MSGSKTWPSPSSENSPSWTTLLSLIKNWGKIYHPPLLPTLTFHGTGSASPTLQRLPSCLTVTHPPTGTYFMLDCGEGASSNVSDDKGLLIGVFVGHRHHDHAGGIAAVVEKVVKRGNRRVENRGECKRCGKIVTVIKGKRKMGEGEGTCKCRREICVIADETVRYELDCLMGCEEGREVTTGNRIYLPIDLGELDTTGKGGGEHWGNAYDGRVRDRNNGMTGGAQSGNNVMDLESVLGGWKISTFPTLHCYQSHGCILTLPQPSNFKICYTGDTRPHGTVERAVNSTPGGVDLLVHEATFRGDRKDDAVAKKHSTDDEAKGVFGRCNAKAMVMTHFSQRYGYREGAVDGGRLGLDGRIRERVDIMYETNRIIRGGEEEEKAEKNDDTNNEEDGGDGDENEIDIE
ncbi:hypothetical protein TrCOL_g2572 [Triparma columacea]|uniref:ribonuclease Z n=1 Tax=Triparma columacea TaxID=722753 RepID=A0A9W7GJJ2_9STRA|nr:hypothetical protein TrCOL_g2572 [Triparma columacea]